MALNARDFLIEAGGGLDALFTRVPVNRAQRMLVIGLGGTGLDALLRIKQVMSRRFVNERADGSAPAPDVILPDYIQLLGIDTDQSTEYSCEGVTLNRDSEFLPISSSGLISWITTPTLRSQYINEWFSPYIPPVTLTDGAGGVRQLGRMCFFANFANIRMALTSKLHALQTGAPGPISIVIVSGISGGTGSGSMLDAAFIARKIASEMVGPERVSLTGYLFMPDINLSVDGLPEGTRKYIPRNGYATLLELDYLMNLPERCDPACPAPHEEFRQQYAADFAVVTRQRPFDSVYLLSATDAQGVKRARPYDYAMQVAAESVINRMVHDPDRRGAPALNAVDVNGVSEAPGVVAIEDSEGRPHVASYIYRAVGAACASLPLEDITNYLAYRLFDRMNALLSLNPAPEDIQGVVDRLGLVPNPATNLCPACHSLIAEARQEVSRVPMQALPARNTPVNSETARISFENRLSAHADAALRYAEQKKPALLEQMQKQLRDEMNAAFCDPKKGPFYVNHLLAGYQTEDGIGQKVSVAGLTSKLQALSEALTRELTAAVGEADAMLERARAVAREADQKLLFKDKLYQEYIAAAYAATDARIAYGVKYKYVSEALKALLADAEALNEGLYETYVTVLRTLTDVFRQNGRVITDGQVNVSENARIFTWGVMERQDLLRLVNRQLAEGDTDFDALLADFLKQLVRTSRTWITAARENKAHLIKQEIESFLSEKFASLLAVGMNAYLGEDPARKVSEEIAPKLLRMSSPVFPIMAALPVRTNNISVVTIPNQQSLVDAMGTFISRQVAPVVDAAVHTSSLPDRFFWLNISRRLPLFCHMHMQQFEDAYEAQFAESNGLHLYEGARSWRNDLPSVIPETAYIDHANPRVQARNAKRRALYDDMTRLHMVRYDETLNTHVALISHTDIPAAVNDILARDGVRLADGRLDARRSPLGEVDALWQCRADIESYLQKPFPAERAYILPDTTTAFRHADFYAREDMIRMPCLARVAEEDAARRQYALDVLSLIDDTLNAGARAQKEYGDYVKIRLFGGLTRSGAYYNYTDPQGVVKPLLRQSDMFDGALKKRLDEEPRVREYLLQNALAYEDRCMRSDEGMRELRDAAADFLRDVESTLAVLPRNPSADGTRAVYASLVSGAKALLHEYSL